MFKTKFLIAAVLGVWTPVLSLADQMGPQGDKFYEEAAHFENACKNAPTCKAPYRRQVVYSVTEGKNKISQDLQKSLQKIAFEQAQIWGDTILEGDYVADGNTRLDEVTAYYKSNKIVGYKIQYSEKAWYTGDCNYDGKQESLKECRQGRISEVSYVSPDLMTYFSDEERYAQFAMTLN